MDDLETKKEIYSAFKDGDFDKAEELTLKLMEEDLQNPALEQLLKISKFWHNRRALFEYSDENGENLIEEWDKFLDFCQNNGVNNKKAILATKEFVFQNIVDFLIENYKTSSMPSIETLILLGHSFYEVGIIDKAVETLEYALSISRGNEDVRIYVLLGNLYAAQNNQGLAMLMFNEAFLKFPQFVDLNAVDFPPIHKAKELAIKDGFEENELLEWIPIYGYLYNALTVKRKLDYTEYEELKQRITDYEKSLQIDKKVIYIIIPRLINYYLWVFDYCFFQIKALGTCKNIMKRINELITMVPVHALITEELKEKLRIKAVTVLKGIMSE